VAAGATLDACAAEEAHKETHDRYKPAGRGHSEGTKQVCSVHCDMGPGADVAGTFTKLNPGKCRARVREDGVYRGKTFTLNRNAVAWAAEELGALIESSSARGPWAVPSTATLGDMTALQPALTRRITECSAFHISKKHSNDFALVFDPRADGCDLVAMVETFVLEGEGGGPGGRARDALAVRRCAAGAPAQRACCAQHGPGQALLPDCDGAGRRLLSSDTQRCACGAGRSRPARPRACGAGRALSALLRSQTSGQAGASRLVASAGVAP
jgi:hypothetical protein